MLKSRFWFCLTACAATLMVHADVTRTAYYWTGGDGTLRFVPGSKIGFLPSMGVGKAAWTTVATVGAVEGLPENDRIKFRVRANADGTQSLQCRDKVGCTIFIR